MNATYKTVTSADGTQIAYDQTGDGPPAILIGGAFNDRSTVAGLAAVLAAELTAVGYDRRGRGDSGDSANYAVEREVEDLVALIGQVGGAASVFGHSSGAVLALEAAERGAAIEKLAVYEPPYIAGSGGHRPPADLADQVRALIGEDRRDDAVTLFLTESVGIPAKMVDSMRTSDMWGRLVRLAHTLPYDLTLCGPGSVLPADRLAKIQIPVLAIGGSLSPKWLRAGARAVADAIAGARYETLEGQEHGVLNQPEALRPLLIDFLS